MDPRTMYAFDTTAVPWVERLSERIGRAVFRKVLYNDSDNVSRKKRAKLRSIQCAFRFVDTTSTWRAAARTTSG